MARPRRTRQAIKDAAGPIRQAFLKVVREKRLTIKDVEQAVQTNGDLEKMLALDEADLSDVTEAIRDAYKEGGKLEGELSLQSQGATQFLSDNSAELVTAIAEGQREALQEVLSTAQVIGQNPRDTALDIVGRVNSSGRREGGIVGLNGPQANAVNNAKANLRSGDPSRMRQYLNNERRDRRYDHIVNAAIDAEKPVNKEDLHRITTRYQARLLKTRGDTIARTESLEAVSAGKMESIDQQQASGKLGDVEVYKEWVHGGGGESREDHLAMDGEEVPKDEPFILPDGTQMMHPGDRAGGAENNANCHCTTVFHTRRAA